MAGTSTDMSPSGLRELAAMNARVYAMSLADRERWYRNHPVENYVASAPSADAAALPKVTVWIQDPTGAWFVPDPVTALLAVFRAAGDDSMAYSAADIERILGGLTGLTELRERLARSDADEFDAAILRRAGAILKDRFGKLTAGDLIAALDKAAMTIEEGQ